MPSNTRAATAEKSSGTADGKDVTSGVAGRSICSWARRSGDQKRSGVCPSRFFPARQYMMMALWVLAPLSIREHPGMILSTPGLVVWSLLAAAADRDKSEAVTVGEAKANDQGFLVHEVRSPYQAGTTLIRVLLP